MIVNELQAYEDAVKQHGDEGWRTSFYLSPDFQMQTYAVITQVGPLSGSLLDAGCNQGDYYAYLKNRRIKVDYHGVDICGPAIEIAKRKYPEARFDTMSLMDIQGEYDWVIAAGAFNFKKENADAVLFDSVNHLFGMTKKGLAFTLLTDWTQDKYDTLLYYEPQRVIELVTLFTRKFKLLHHHKDNEMCLHLYK